VAPDIGATEGPHTLRLKHTPGRHFQGVSSDTSNPGPKAGPVSKLGNTFVSELGDTPVGRNPLGVSEKG
jgi:hypothetical protein